MYRVLRTRHKHSEQNLYVCHKFKSLFKAIRNHLFSRRKKKKVYFGVSPLKPEGYKTFIIAIAISCSAIYQMEWIISVTGIWDVVLFHGGIWCSYVYIHRRHTNTLKTAKNTLNSSMSYTYIGNSDAVYLSASVISRH